MNTDGLISEQLEIVLVDEAKLLEAQSCVSRCEFCDEHAAISFDYLLDAVTGWGPWDEYLLCRVAVCPNCRSQVTEKTRIVTL